MSKPNILFIGPVRQYCGWGSAAKDYARALATIGNVTVRNIFLSNQREQKLPPDIELMENSLYDHYDAVIQKALPQYYSYDGRFKNNIGMMVFETELNNNAWFNNMNMMDSILVPSYLEKRWLEKKLKIPVYNVREPLNIEAGKKQYPSINEMLSDKKIFKFLFIGEAIERKGIRELLQAYFQEFNINDNVLLVIKTSTDISQEISHIRASMRRFTADTKYPHVLLIPNRLSEDQISSLHQDSHVFVMPSLGEAFNRPAAKSLVFGKPVIVTNNTGMLDYVGTQADVGWLIDSSVDQVYSEQPPVPNVYTSNELYHVPNILSLRRCMKEAYRKEDIYRAKCEAIIKTEIAEYFSYTSVGNEILKAIK